MFILGSEESWFCNTATDRNIDFCIWALETDGLHVPPFERHSGGDGSLQAAGMDVESWRSWVEGMLRSRDQHQYASQKHTMQTANESIKLLLDKAGLPNEPQSAAAQQYLKAHMQEFHQLWQEARKTRPELLFPNEAYPPCTAWSGSPEVSKRLIELWEQYMRVANKRLLAWEQGLETTSLATVNLWEDLKPYHSRLDSLMIHFVVYPQELDYLVSPRSIVMTIVKGPL